MFFYFFIYIVMKNKETLDWDPLKSIKTAVNYLKSIVLKSTAEVKEIESPNTISGGMFRNLLQMENDQWFVAKKHWKFWESFVTWPYGMVYKNIDPKWNPLKSKIPFKAWERVTKEWAEKNARVHYDQVAKKWAEELKNRWFKYTQSMLDALVSASNGTARSVNNLKKFVFENWNKWISIIGDFIMNFATRDQNGKQQQGLVRRRKFEANWFKWILEPFTKY